MPEREESLHALLGWIAGMCADEEPHHLIAAKVMEAKELAHRLEAALHDTEQRLIVQRAAARRLPPPTREELFTDG